jgi:hypothetical protein
MRFLSRCEVASRFEGKSVAIVGSGPGALGNRVGLIDGHDIVVRVNNYRCFAQTGFRTDVFYSFFGRSIKKTATDLARDGVKLCLCKCPDADGVIESPWHRKNGKDFGVDFAWIYRRRAKFWFCDTYIPSVDEFLCHFHLLGGHVPTTGFSAILDVRSYNPASIYLTGFDFFRSGKHNVTDRWVARNDDDPIGHVPEMELRWLAQNFDHRMTADRALTEALATVQRTAA